MRNYKIKKYQKGLSLIELMIAMVLGIIVILGVSQGLTTMMLSSRAQLNNNSLQQTSDVALSYIGFKLRNALSTPCEQFGRTNRLTVGGMNNLANATTVENLIKGRGVAIQQNIVGIGGQSMSTDDIELIESKDRLFITGDTGITNPVIQASGQFNDYNQANWLNQHPLYIITDCQTIDVFQAASVGLNSGATTITASANTKFKSTYRERNSAMVAFLEASKIRIDANGNLSDTPLFATGAGGQSLVSDVETMRILFGVDAAGDDGIADRYITASELASLSTNINVVSAEIYLLVHAQNGSTAVPASYTITLPDTAKPIPANGTIPQQTFTFTDRVMRRVFSRSVSFRNKVPLL
ncbi:MAG: PilW family protein [Ostreibacterium sp.]